MFFSDSSQNTFTFNDTVFNGTMFWNLGENAQSTASNSLGVVQYAGDKLDFSNVRYIHGDPDCDPTKVIPEPHAILVWLLLGGGWGAVVYLRQRSTKSAEMPDRLP